MRMSSTYLSPSLNFYKKRIVIIMVAYWLISALSVSEKFVYHLRFLALYCLVCSNTRFTLPFASWIASAPIPVSLRLGNGIVGLKYWRILVLTLEKKTASEKRWNLFNIVILHKAGHIYYCCFSWNS